MKKKLIILGLVKNKKGEFLISQRHDPDVPKAHLKWDLPGGQNEFGETLEETVKREVLEETGLKVSVQKMFPASATRTWEHKDYKIHVVILCYLCEMKSGKLHHNDHKINDLKWIKKEEFDNFDFLPTIKKFLDLT